MDTRKLNQSLSDLTNLKFELSKIDYADEAYDELEEELHEMEDGFQEDFGTFLETVIQEIHDEHCPESDVLPAIAYIGKKPVLKGIAGEGSPLFEPHPSDGVPVEAEDYPDKMVRLVLLPNPARLILNIGGTTTKEVWKLA